LRNADDGRMNIIVREIEVYTRSTRVKQTRGRGEDMAANQRVEA
jgi:hypothetical protein